MKRSTHQCSNEIIKVIATGFKVIAIIANVIMGVGFLVKKFVVMVVKVWDLEEVFDFSIRGFIDYFF